MSAQIKERPILFQGAMVRALLDGTKTQTRRVMKAPWDVCDGEPIFRCGPDGHGFRADKLPPYGQPGDHLWVRETFGEFIDTEVIDGATHELGRDYVYRADGDGVRVSTRWTPSIHMPRAASRILLEIVSVRVERLNECSEADAKAEGVMQLDADESQRPEERTKEGWALCPTCCGTGLHSTLGAGGGVNFDVDCQDCDTHAKLYRHLWESINGAGSWATNPWVWVVEFRLCDQK